jgi:aminotransferase in exopolysaccharide biosynthesis
MTAIPLSEPTLQGRELEYVSESLRSTWISSNGEFISRFEQAISEWTGVRHVVACNCGTSALHVSLLLSGVRPEDEVIVPSVTFIAPVNSVRYAGAAPVFIGCDEYCCIDVAALRRFLTEECDLRDGRAVDRVSGRRIAAVIPVHVFGTPADMDAIGELAAMFGLAVVEDASEAIGSKYRGRQCGGLAALACLSFNGNKIVTSGGGGAILTDDDALAEGARYLTTQAKEAGIEYIHNEVGYNYRMNNVLAALGLAQMETLQNRLDAKHRNFALYEEALGPHFAGRLLGQPEWSEANRWFYAYVCRDAQAKERLLVDCIAASVQARPLWYPNHLQRPYAGDRAFAVDRATWFYDRVVNLPCSVSLTEDEIATVASVIRASEDRRGAAPATKRA